MPGIVFGLAEYKEAVAGLHLQDVTYGESGSTVEGIDEDDNIEQVDVHSRKRTINFNGNVEDGADLSALTVGADLSVSDVTYKIDSIQIKHTNTGHATCSGSGSAPMPADSETPAASSSGTGS